MTDDKREIQLSGWTGSTEWLCACYHELLLTTQRQQCCVVVVSQVQGESCHEKVLIGDAEFGPFLMVC